jgi:hypothetical protein
MREQERGQRWAVNSVGRQHGIHYANLDAQGIHVGSGPVEMAADLLIQSPL